MQQVGRKKGKRVWKEEEKRKVRKKKEGKGVDGICGSFSFCSLCLSLLPFSLSIHHATTLLLTLTLTHRTAHHHHTIAHREHATQPRRCAVMFLVCVLLCLCVTVCLLIPHSTKQHNAMETGNHHTWDNQWMRQRVNGKEQWSVDTTAQTRGTRRK